MNEDANDKIAKMIQKYAEDVVHELKLRGIWDIESIKLELEKRRRERKLRERIK